MDQLAINWGPQRRIYTVRELTSAIADYLSREFSNIWVSGEISGVKLHTSGHCYFTLKESNAVLKCVCYKGAFRLLKFKPQDGIAVLARGRVEVYEPRGEYQLIVETLEPQGLGALQAAFEQLKKKLAQEGLFEAGRKRPLPALPWRIGIVTSPTGAVIRDMLHILRRRLPGVHIRLYPAVVQGEGAVEAVCEGIRYFSESGWPEVVIVARGGGSLEDLWTFNEEPVARAIAERRAPVISAIGHETDFTIADFVADLRAPTPSAAAELVVPTQESLLERIEGAIWKLQQGVRYRIAEARRRLGEQGIERGQVLVQRKVDRLLQRVDDGGLAMKETIRERLRATLVIWQEFDGRLVRQDVRLRFAEVRRRLEAAQAAAVQAARLRTVRAGTKYGAMEAMLGQLSPLKVLERGYAVVQDEGGKVVKDAGTVVADQPLDVRLARGRLKVLVSGSTGLKR
jgi:exodeoxyribonuclease VII large subunit